MTIREEIMCKASENWPIHDENWENVIRNPWSTATDPYIEGLFANEGWLFYSLLMAVTVMVSYVKSEKMITPLAVFILMGALLSGMLTIGSAYYFLVATGAGIGIVLYMLVK